MTEKPFTLQQLRDRLQGRPRRELPADESRSAAVLVPLFRRGGEWHVLLTKRTDTVSTHKGQISFPGGRREPHDESLLHTALRESHEEIGLAPHHVEVLGALDDTTTLKAMRITPFVGLIPDAYPFAPHPGEVAYLLEVPLSHFLDPDRLRVEQVTYPDGFRGPVYFYSTEGEVVWGATARIIKEWLDLVI